MLCAHCTGPADVCLVSTRSGTEFTETTTVYGLCSTCRPFLDGAYGPREQTDALAAVNARIGAVLA